MFHAPTLKMKLVMPTPVINKMMTSVANELNGLIWPLLARRLNC